MSADELNALEQYFFAILWCTVVYLLCVAGRYIMPVRGDRGTWDVVTPAERATFGC